MFINISIQKYFYVLSMIQVGWYVFILHNRHVKNKNAKQSFRFIG